MKRSRPALILTRKYRHTKPPGEDQRKKDSATYSDTAEQEMAARLDEAIACRLDQALFVYHSLMSIYDNADSEGDTEIEGERGEGRGGEGEEMGEKGGGEEGEAGGVEGGVGGGRGLGAALDVKMTTIPSLRLLDLICNLLSGQAEAAAENLSNVPLLAVYARLLLDGFFLQAHRVAVVALREMEITDDPIPQLRPQGRKFTQQALCGVLLKTLEYTAQRQRWKNGGGGTGADPVSRILFRLQGALQAVMGASTPEEMPSWLEKGEPMPTEPDGLREALNTGDYRCVQQAFDEMDGAHPPSGKDLNSAASMAVRHRDWALFYSCLDRGAHVTATDSVRTLTKPKSSEKRRKALALCQPGSSPIHAAVQTGDFSLEEFFDRFPRLKGNAVLANSAHVKQREQGLSLLHFAATCGDVDTRIDNVTALLQNGADVNAPVISSKTTFAQDMLNRRKLSTLHPHLTVLHELLFDFSMDHVEIIAALVCESQRGEQQRVRWTTLPSGMNELHTLVREGAFELIKLFVDQGADPEELCHGLTLVDACVLGPCSGEGGAAYGEAGGLRTMDALLSPPCSLGPYHAATAQARWEEGRAPYDYGEDAFPLPHLLGCLRHHHHHHYHRRPMRRAVIKAAGVRAAEVKAAGVKAAAELMRRMVEGGAVCPAEKEAVDAKFKDVHHDDDDDEVEEEWRDQRQFLADSWANAWKGHGQGQEHDQGHQSFNGDDNEGIRKGPDPSPDEALLEVEDRCPCQGQGLWQGASACHDQGQSISQVKKEEQFQQEETQVDRNLDR